MQIKTALYNADHLEYGIVTIPFPIPKDQYHSTIKMLEAFDIGEPRERDCTVREVLGPVPSLKCLEGTQINVDELDYLKGGRDAAKLANRTRYVATRPGVEVLPEEHGDQPATKKQQEYIRRLLRDFPDAQELLEYEDYQSNPTRKTASVFIQQVREDCVEAMSQRENYLDYVAHRPGVMPSLMVFRHASSKRWAKADSSGRLSSSPRRRRPPVQAKMVAMGLVEVFSPFCQR